eukprot:3236259-Prorocentrum_lima.AAC.1
MPCSVAYRGLKKVLPGFGKGSKGSGKASGKGSGPQVVTKFPGNYDKNWIMLIDGFMVLTATVMKATGGQEAYVD